MIFNNEELEDLRTAVKKRLSPKRYEHTIGVEDMARHLGGVLIPERISELSVASLLHDISKEIPYDVQVKLLSESSVICSDEDLLVRPALHSISAIPLIERDFSEFATPDVLSAVLHHTLGACDMTVFDEIIFISDYTEAGRTYPNCRQLREYLLNNISGSNSQEDNLYALHRAVLKAIEFTVESLRKRGETIHQKTLAVKRYFEEIVKNYNY